VPRLGPKDSGSAKVPVRLRVGPVGEKAFFAKQRCTKSALFCDHRDFDCLRHRRIHENSRLFWKSAVFEKLRRFKKEGASGAEWAARALLKKRVALDIITFLREERLLEKERKTVKIEDVRRTLSEKSTR
jgi:hypothetical protein